MRLCFFWGAQHTHTYAYMDNAWVFVIFLATFTYVISAPCGPLQAATPPPRLPPSLWGGKLNAARRKDLAARLRRVIAAKKKQKRRKQQEEELREAKTPPAYRRDFG